MDRFAARKFPDEPTADTDTPFDRPPTIGVGRGRLRISGSGGHRPGGRSALVPALVGEGQPPEIAPGQRLRRHLGLLQPRRDLAHGWVVCRTVRSSISWRVVPPKYVGTRPEKSPPAARVHHAAKRARTASP